MVDEFYVDGLSVNEESSELRESNYTKIGFSVSLLVDSELENHSTTLQN